MRTTEIRGVGGLAQKLAAHRGRRTSVTDANGKTTAYAYDDADRLTASRMRLERDVLRL